MKESHYNKGGIEVIDFIQDQLTPEEFNGFCKGNILKYVPRSNHKGDPIADAQKVRDYADYWISANLRTKKVEAGILEKDDRMGELIDEAKMLRKVNGELENIIRQNNKELALRVSTEKAQELADTIVELRRDNAELKEDLKKAEKDRFNSVKMAEALRESVDRLQKENRRLKDAIEKKEKDSVADDVLDIDAILNTDDDGGDPF